MGARNRPVLISAINKDDDKSTGTVISGAAAVKEEARKIETRINACKQSFPCVAAKMMKRLAPFPEQGEVCTEWAREVCTRARYSWALSRTGVDVGVGADGFPGYLVRKAPARIQELYLETLRGRYCCKRTSRLNGRSGTRC